MAGPVDPLAVHLDNEMINALVVEPGRYFFVSDAAFSDVVTDLAKWRAEVEAKPIPELMELDCAVAAVVTARIAQRESDLLAVRSSRLLSRFRDS